jgi:hypothetical protein
MSILRAIAGVLGASAATTPWAYPLAASWTDRGLMLPSPQAWDFIQWLPSSQGLVEVGGTAYYYLEGGQSPGHADWADFSAFGLATSQDGITWTEHPSNPLATFLPRGVASGDILTAEGYFFHAILILPTGQFICAFGGQTATSSSDVKIDMFRQTSNDGITWSPNNAAGSALIAAWNTSGWAHYFNSSTYNEVCPGGLWYDVANSTLHMLYNAKTESGPKEWEIYHVFGSDIASFAGANSAKIFQRSQNPVEVGGEFRGSAIIDRGGGVVDCLFIAINVALDTHALCRLPILPDYSWTAPGPPEILYYLQSDFGVIGWSDATVAFYAAASLALMPYFADGVACGNRTAPAVRTSDGRLPYSPGNSAHFTHTSTQRIGKTSSLAGIANSSSFSFACWFKTSTVQRCSILSFEKGGGGGELTVVLTADNKVGLWATNAAGGALIDLYSAASAYTNATEYVLMVAVDLTAGYANGLRIWLNNVDIKAATQGTNTFTNGTIGLTTPTVNCCIGADYYGTGASSYDGDLTNIGFQQGLFIDWGVTAIRRRCVTSDNKMQEPETDGRRWFGRKPILFVRGDQTGILTNRGTGGGSFVFSGTGSLTAGSAPTGHS